MSPLLPIRPQEVVAALGSLVQEALQQPANLLTAFAKLSMDQVKVLTGNSELSLGDQKHRFKDERWENHPYYRRALQFWLTLKSHSHKWLDGTRLDNIDTRRARFFLDIAVGSLSPNNFVFTNPEAIDATLEAKGRNLLQGLHRRLTDVRNNAGLPTQVDATQFAVGRNLAVTPGQVIYRTEMFELIQYTPTTGKVHATPLLLISPYVNKFYILDLKPGRSLVEYLVSRGFSVFLVAWRNPGPEQGDWGFDNYVASVINALRIVRKISAYPAVNLAALCSGGVLSTLAACVLESKGKNWINTHTLIVSVLDSRPEDTELGLVCTPRAVKLAKKQVRRQGIFKAKDLLWSFNLMQPEKLLWDTSIRYYLLGKDPGASEVMFWMNDQVNLPALLYGESLDHMLQNPLPTAEALTVLDTPIDLGSLTTATYILGAYYDHIMPCDSVYRTRNLLGASTEFVLTNGGHITPCITAADNPRARYYTNAGAAESYEEWIDAAEEQPGSWQAHWVEWLRDRSGEQIPAQPDPGSEDFPSLTPAPGTYVHE